LLYIYWIKQTECIYRFTYKHINQLNIYFIYSTTNLNGFFICLNLIRVSLISIKTSYIFLLDIIEYLITVQVYTYIKFKIGWGRRTAATLRILLIILAGKRKDGVDGEHRGTEKLCEYKSVDQCLLYLFDLEW